MHQINCAGVSQKVRSIFAFFHSRCVCNFFCCPHVLLFICGTRRKCLRSLMVAVRVESFWFFVVFGMNLRPSAGCAILHLGTLNSTGEMSTTSATTRMSKFSRIFFLQLEAFNFRLETLTFSQGQNHLRGGMCSVIQQQQFSMYGC